MPMIVVDVGDLELLLVPMIVVDVGPLTWNYYLCQ